jgi:hypothetical protein
MTSQPTVGGRPILVLQIPYNAERKLKKPLTIIDTKPPLA